ncbi:MAG: ADP-ribosylglycohydrolase family protein [Spirochaetaceae bacterium]|nr:ADP-ribosylglycohydrolase family protein [Spirochaetaceae bacterium]
MTTDSYRNAVLKAVNLGEDTDTTAAVTGGLTGLITTLTKAAYRLIGLRKWRDVRLSLPLPLGLPTGSERQEWYFEIFWRALWSLQTSSLRSGRY